MSGRRLAFALAAESFAGAPFRFRGRDPLTGLDCVGLAAAALTKLGAAARPLPPYTMRQGSFAAQLACVGDAGFEPTDGEPSPGDLLLVRPAPAQAHLVIVGTGGSLVHAHAGLGRVVLTPCPCPWPIERHWRLQQD